LPFRFETPADYDQRLSAWIAEVFYERLPAAGYQVREEQIYLSFRMATALRGRRPLLAEGGSGTGKTFAYLLPLLCQARRTGRPAVVATATAALQQQLAGPSGDAATLSRILDLGMDVRVAVRPEDAVCDIRVERLQASPRRPRGAAALLRWWRGSAFGARAEFPEASDALWARVAWTPACRCDVCPRRGHCRLMKGRAHVRAAADLVVCDHDLFFRDMRDRSEGLAPGRLPVLPAFSAVVFDEGHRVAEAAQKALGARLVPSVLARTIASCHGQDVRERLLRLAEVAAAAARAFTAALEAAKAPAPGERRIAVRRTPALLASSRRLAALLVELQDEMTVEEGLHAETPYGERLAGSQAVLDAAGEVLARLSAGDDSVLWVEGGALWAVPRRLEPVWRYVTGIPMIFTSATLSAGGDFGFSERVLGLADAATARVGVPFGLAQQVVCLWQPGGVPLEDAAFWEDMARRVAALLGATRGRALVLLPRPADTQALRAHWLWSGPTLWEGDAAAESQLDRLRRELGSVLVGSSFWEGVDVPGEALSLVAIPLLPLPGADPRDEALREDAARAGLEPRSAVDVPAMVIRLRQGMGRLIRTEFDRGVLALLDPRLEHAAYRAAVEDALPLGAARVDSLDAVQRFLDAGGGTPDGDQAPRPTPAASLRGERPGGGGQGTAPGSGDGGGDQGAGPPPRC
jgi:ATP-dependent DNA helicase DinG